jgi:hypothetical protein
MLKEKLSFSGIVGISQCIFGSVIIVMNAPASNTTKTVAEFFSYVLQPGFLVYTVICVGIVLYVVFHLGPRYGSKHPAVYISVVAIAGSYLVLSAQGWGAAIVYSVEYWETDNQFKLWSFYLLMFFVAITAVNQINFLNKALNCFSPSIVAPINYVFFTTMTLVSSAVLFQGFNVPTLAAGISMLIGFLVIVGGVALIFQYSLKLNKLKLVLHQVEDINDADMEAEEETMDENPIKMLHDGMRGAADVASSVVSGNGSGPSSNGLSNNHQKGKVVPELGSLQQGAMPFSSGRVVLEPVSRKADGPSHMERGLAPIQEDSSSQATAKLDSVSQQTNQHTGNFNSPMAVAALQQMHPSPNGRSPIGLGPIHSAQSNQAQASGDIEGPSVLPNSSYFVQQPAAVLTSSSQPFSDQSSSKSPTKKADLIVSISTSNDSIGNKEDRKGKTRFIGDMESEPSGSFDDRSGSLGQLGHAPSQSPAVDGSWTGDGTTPLLTQNQKQASKKPSRPAETSNDSLQHKKQRQELLGQAESKEDWMW